MKEQLLAVGGVLSAAAASTCCVVPLALVTVGLSGAWIGNLTALAPYQPVFVLVAVACLGAGFWFLNRRSQIDCRTRPCADPVARRLIESALWVKTILWVGTGLLALSVSVDYGARVFL